MARQWSKGWLNLSDGKASLGCSGLWFLVLAYRIARIEEIVWVKTNQLQRIIRTGRTGHWILGLWSMWMCLEIRESANVLFFRFFSLPVLFFFAFFVVTLRLCPWLRCLKGSSCFWECLFGRLRRNVFKSCFGMSKDQSLQGTLPETKRFESGAAATGIDGASSAKYKNHLLSY